MPRHVLVVEDDPDIREVVCAFLRDEGFSTEGASTLSAARTLLRSARFAALVLDLGLPDGDGTDLLGEMSVRTIDMPVVVASGAVDDDLITHRYGVSVVRKPFDLDVLLVAITVAIENGLVPRRP